MPMMSHLNMFVGHKLCKGEWVLASAREVLCTSHFFAIALHDLHVVAAHDIPEGLVQNVRNQ